MRAPTRAGEVTGCSPKVVRSLCLSGIAAPALNPVLRVGRGGGWGLRQALDAGLLGRPFTLRGSWGGVGYW
jgi:hypothetical protein